MTPPRGVSPRRPSASTSPIKLSAEVGRAATALKAEGKELLAVLTQLRQRCGATVLRAPSGKEANIYLSFPSDGYKPDRSATFKLANAAGLRRVDVLPWSGGPSIQYCVPADAFCSSWSRGASCQA